MTLAPTATAPPADPSLTLTATRRLAILDELRMPYRAGGDGGRREAWASVSAGEPDSAVYWFTGREGPLARGWRLGTLPVWGRVAAEPVTVRLVRSLPGRFVRDAPILDGGGIPRAWVWRSDRGATILPFDPDELVANVRRERYLHLQGPGHPDVTAVARRAYYGVRPMLPRPTQIRMRRVFTHVQALRRFPRWPWEPGLHDLVDFVTGCVATAAGRPLPSIAPWPQGRSWALVLTHDVETAAGRDRIVGLRAVEAAAGYRSSWNFVPERYRVDDALLSRLRADGCEIGVHGLRHDGRDLESLATLERRLPEIRRWARRWGAVGFRSPATHRVWEWMPKLGFDYDSSYPDSDPFEPMAGGCCCWLPFFNGRMVELPITLPQDHTLFEILRRDDSAWRMKADLLRSRGGMALAVIHPDYMLGADRLRSYRRFLDAFRDDAAAWKALPHEVATWWRRRAATSLVAADGGWRPRGPAEREAAVVLTSPGH